MNIFGIKKKKDSKVQDHFLTALRLVEWGDLEAAELLFEKCVLQGVNLAYLHFHLGDVRQRLDKQEAAVQSYREYLKLDPADTMGVAIRLSLMGVNAPLELLPARYVECLFDQYAPSFEKCLLENLEYNVPESMGRMVFELRKNNFERVLDLGCGTGLSAIPFKARAAQIDGVDISRGMLQIAKQKQIYDALHAADIHDFLKKTDTHYDLVLCADVLIYLGRADMLLAAVAEILTDSGLFACSVQTLKEGDFLLGADHRFSHSGDYIQKCAALAGLQIVSVEETVLRKEDGLPVEGMIFVYEKKKRLY